MIPQSSQQPMRRVRTKTYSVTLYLVLLAVLIQLGVIVWNFSIRNQVKIDIQAPEVPMVEEILPPPLHPSTKTSEKNQVKPIPLGNSAPPSSQPITPIPTIPEQVQHLLSDAQGYLDHNENSLARNSLLEAERLQPENTEVLKRLADLAEKIQNNELANEYRQKIQTILSTTQEPTPSPDKIPEKIASAPLENLEPTKATSSSSPSPATSSTDLDANLSPVVPPAHTTPSISSAKRILIGPIEKKSLQSSNAKTEFLLKIPLISTASDQPIEPGKISIKLYFYELLTDGKILPSTARLDVSFENRRPTWSENSETLNALYSLSSTQTNRSYFGYRMRVYYKNQFQSEISEPDNLNDKYPMPY